MPDLNWLDNPPPSFLTGRKLLLVNGQSGIWILTERLSPGSAWIPSYICSSVVRALRRHDVRVRFYEVDDGLEIASPAWLDQVRPGELVLLIDYFGFPSNASFTARAKERGAWVVQDACQALLSRSAATAVDFTLFSPRKFVGVPDGGILQIHCAAEFDGVPLARPPAEWWLPALRASLLRREFDLHGGAREWFELFQKSEAGAPCGPFAMSELSTNLLLHCYDYVRIAEQRRQNYAVLCEALRRFAVFPDLPAQVVPLGFPMRAKDRDRVRQALFTQEIFPAVHWRIEDVVPSEYEASHRLAAEILTLPCDQRYSSGDMEQMAAVVLDACRA